ncbi:Alanyl-tRNA editing protein Aarsd1 [Holothuria leucospilota]|uniref:Alanyl-tRNA editing protein Aarsd1 n=1 Tax=Holothuria leucospilota TaxID=206669 RepID=A0A9Q1BYY2_HOLLE|nr:Alanyl-tRNA editing protein Aarsd1 [Holothuria leucospilota]
MVTIKAPIYHAPLACMSSSMQVDHPLSSLRQKSSILTKEIMSFICQKDCYLKEFHTKVVSCSPSKLKIAVNGKKEVVSGFDVICEDTVLFPEGGGQPDDRGTMNGHEVLRITRVSDKAVHFMKEALEPGTEVHQIVDWSRRFDHMQQHSGQHLVTAIADEKYGWPTTSWDLGREKSFIELDTPKISNEQLEQLEKDVNEAIRKCLPMMPRWVEVGSEELQKVRTRGLPEDHVGLVRIVEIESIEANMCCGTHVSNLSHLQMIKLISAEKGKKNKTNLYYVAGDRVLKYLAASIEVEKKLNKLLKCGQDEYAQAVEKQQKTLKATNKSNLLLLREIAVLEGQRYLNQPNRDVIFCLHRKEGDSEFLNMVANEIGSQNALMLLSVGDEKTSGLFLIAGPEEVVAVVGPKVEEALKGKGSFKNGRYQGKASQLCNRPTAENILREHADKRKVET